MIAFFAFVVVVGMVIAAIWWKPKKTLLASSLPSFGSAFPVKNDPQDRYIQIIAQEVRRHQDEIERKEAFALFAEITAKQGTTP
jgi:hypothetical protein